MTNIINLADHRPATPRRPSRLGRIADDALCTLVVAAGLCTIAWFPGAALVWLVSRALAVPWYLDIFLKGAPAVLVGIWAALSMRRLPAALAGWLFDQRARVRGRGGRHVQVRRDG